MRKYYLSILFLICTIQTLYCENKKYTYLIEIDSTVNLSKFKKTDDLLNLEDLKNIKKEEFGLEYEKVEKFKNLIHSLNPVSIRKLLRHLPDTTKFLNYKKGNEILQLSVEFPQRIYVVESYDSLRKSDFEMFKKNHNNLTNIDYSGNVEASQWPPNDPELIGLDGQHQYANNPYNIDLPRAWRHTYGNSAIKVAIIDHGVSYTHPDLGGGIGSGFRVRGGWDFKDNDAYPLPVFETNKSETHGTPIAGIISALNNNSTGVVGIAGGWETIESGVQLFSFRVSSDEVDDGDRLLQRSLIIEALVEAAADPAINNGFGYKCDIINCSFSCMPSGPFDCNYWDWSTLTGQSTYWAYAFAYTAGATIVAARGNDGTDDPLFPATYSNSGVLISVSALNNQGGIVDIPGWWASSFGDGVTISAPGEIGTTTAVNVNGNGYGFFNGTSNAAPFVCGTAALVLSRLYERDIIAFPEDVRHIIQIGSEDAGPTGYDDEFGWGRLDAGQSVHIVSQPFVLEHYDIPYEELDVEEVDFPDPDILCLRVPFLCSFVRHVYRIRGTFSIPDKFQDLDSVWVWANSITTGLTWGNPSWGINGATIIERDGREFTFETYLYRLLTEDGSQEYWWPPSQGVDPHIAISLLGKDNSCIENIYLNNNYIDKYDYYKAKNRITAETNVILTSNSDVTFKARQEIILGSGFVALHGCNFSAIIEDCYFVEEELLKNSTENDGRRKFDELLDTLVIHPNPFTDNTRISFTLIKSDKITITVFDILGNKILTLVEKKDFSEGSYEYILNSTNIPSGIYTIILQSDNDVISERIAIIK